VIPEVRYGAWQPDPSKESNFSRRGRLVRFLTCPGCDTILGRQRTDDPDVLGDQADWPWPRETILREEIWLIPGLSARGRRRYGAQRARPGRPARPRVRKVRGIVTEGSEWDVTTGQPRLGRPSLTLRPCVDDILPGDPPIWFPQGTRLPAEVYCLNCGRALLLTGIGPEGAKRWNA
jgi:hypothetical protein